MPADDEYPYWRRYYGIGTPYKQTPSVRRGCMLVLGAMLVAIAVILVGALLVFLLS